MTTNLRGCSTLNKKWNWLDSYYEALEFFYLEPQHISPKTKAALEIKSLKGLIEAPSKLQRVLKHLRTMEVTLNHNLRQFFLLAPDSLRNRFFEKQFMRPFKGSFVMHGRDVDADFGLANSMQPDLLFVSELDVVSIEMKIASKSSVDQILKYALLGLAVELREGTKSHSLILLGSGDFPSLFRNKFPTSEKLREALAGEDLELFLKNKPSSFRTEQNRLKRIVQEMRLHFLNYSNFGRFLTSELPAKADLSSGAEVYRKLIEGLLEEMRERTLL